MLAGTALRNLKPKSKLWVVAGNTWVRAVGTAFNVYRREDGVRVTVSEGAVKVAASRQDVPSDEALARLPVLLLAAGEQVGVRPTGPAKQVLSPPAVEREVARRTGTPHFQDQPLAEVAQELARYTPLRIELAADARDVRIGGTFQTNPTGVESWLKALHDGLGGGTSRRPTGNGRPALSRERRRVGNFVQRNPKSRRRVSIYPDPAIAYGACRLGRPGENRCFAD